jgi:hypothetical protein
MFETQAAIQKIVRLFCPFLSIRWIFAGFLRGGAV